VALLVLATSSCAAISRAIERREPVNLRGLSSTP
jgi:hypothetical protein